MGRGRKYGFSFSWKRAVGISAFKSKIARSTGIPTTRPGRQRKAGQALGCCVVLLILCFGSASAVMISWAATH